MLCRNWLRRSQAQIVCSIALFLFVAASPAAAQTQLPGIVVEGATLALPSEVQQPDGGYGVEAEKLGTAVTVVTGEELRRQQIRHAADALRNLPGVTVSRTGGF